MHYESDAGGGVAPSIEMESVAAVMPYFFSGRVIGCEVEVLGEEGLDISPFLLFGVSWKLRHFDRSIDDNGM